MRTLVGVILKWVREDIESEGIFEKYEQLNEYK